MTEIDVAAGLRHQHQMIAPCVASWVRTLTVAPQAFGINTNLYHTIPGPRPADKDYLYDVLMVL